MVNKRSILTVMLGTTLALSTSSAFATNRPGDRPATPNLIATRATVEVGASLTAPIPFGNNLLNILRALRGLGRVSLPVRDTGPHTYGISDGPDGWDPVGVKGRGLPTDGPAPANTPAR